MKYTQLNIVRQGFAFCETMETIKEKEQNKKFLLEERVDQIKRVSLSS